MNTLRAQKTTGSSVDNNIGHTHTLTSQKANTVPLLKQTPNFLILKRGSREGTKSTKRALSLSVAGG